MIKINYETDSVRARIRQIERNDTIFKISLTIFVISMFLIITGFIIEAPVMIGTSAIIFLVSFLICCLIWLR